MRTASGRHALVALCLLAALLAAPHSVSGQTPDPAVADAIRRLQSVATAAPTVRIAGPTGVASFLSASPGGVRVAAAATAPARDRARAFLDAHGRLFGLRDATGAQVRRLAGPDETGMEHVHLRQESRGIPVAGSGITVHLRGNQVVSALARTVPDADATDVTPDLTAADATATARQVAAELDADDAAFSAPRLELFNRTLFDGRPAATRLAWFVEVTASLRREQIWIDAQSGAVLLHFNQVPEALNRQIHDAMSTATLPGTLVRLEGGPATGDPDADHAYDYSGDTYNYYLTQHGRDSFNNAGATMIATVHSCLCGCPCFNAFWVGTQTVFGLNFASDDLVGHEWTHGVTQYEANLIYFMESGAMNESFSDIFGETVDLTNGTGSDGPANRWWLGEDILPGILAGIRYMYDPASTADPGRMSDPYFVCNDGSDDGGGVHSNSGVGNHAYALMVDGGTYNGYTVAGIGLTKAAKIEYRALTLYLVPASTYADDYAALNQSCTDLIGAAGITAADCVEVQKALDAVEMSSPWPCSSDPPTPTPTATPTPTPTPMCGATPRAGCLGASKGKVLLKHDSADPSKDKLIWKWLKGSTGTLFGNPTSATAYALCLYRDAGGAPVVSAEIPAGGTCNGEPCWDSLGGGAYGYRGDLSADGIQRIKLKPGAGTGKILVKGKGAGLGLPALSLAQPVTVQLVRSGALDCWESVFPAPALKSDAAQFKDTLP